MVTVAIRFDLCVTALLVVGVHVYPLINRPLIHRQEAGRANTYTPVPYGNHVNPGLEVPTVSGDAKLADRPPSK
ncbi:hypothetical protein Mp_2g09920 [Marchantia polymorpha subsp. ruderalis]|uniref:Uncharacterized protein n=1 Tax=Marchantia polymorpha TaxID=3197 RepID=A0A2R6W8I5_MARPO|nr:hypothetical protein MARPO_0129s0018 [Marchantia polymorpha]BBN01745.1 hypothetical protein Mp_2g09920 [Marchantia polymorpha subsp. ruderalis]|eukprot:PTQ30129.1 hypothetical protein MARPO_0129s0018 [Marchantia polymorpha]